MGGVYQRGKVWWIYYSERGKQRHESSGSDLKHKAELKLKQREGRISEGKASGFTLDKVKWDDLKKLYLNDYKVNKKRTEVHAKILANHLAGHFEGMKVVNITSNQISDYIEKRLEVDEVKPATVNNELTALKRMFNLGKQHTPPMVGDVPKITKLEERNVREGFFDHKQFLKLRSKLPKYLYAPITLGYTYGFRKGEILDLTWNRVDFEGNVLRLEPIDTKNKEARTVYLSKECRDLLKAQWEARKDRKVISPLVFFNGADTGPIVDFRKCWATACKDVPELKGKLFHDLRRTAVRNMVRAGIPEKVAMLISGHKTRSIFERYNIVDEKDLKSASKAITKLHKAQPKGSQKDDVIKVDFAKGRKVVKKSTLK